VEAADGSRPRRADQIAGAGELAVRKAINNWRVRPFARGSADCCAFADYIVGQLTGVSYLGHFSYSDDAGAESIIKAHGGLAGAVTLAMRRAPIPPEELRVGDVVLITILDKQAIGILATDSSVVTVFEDAIPRSVRRDFVDMGWHSWV